MLNDTSLLDAARADMEDPLLVNNLLVEMAATDGSIIPRTLIFRPRPNQGGWQIRVCAESEPPSLATMRLARESAIEQLLPEGDEPEGVACIVYPSELANTKGGYLPGALILDWLDLRGNRHTVLVRVERDGLKYSVSPISGDVETSYAKKVEDEGGNTRIGAYAEAVVSQMADAMSPLFRALVPDAPDDDTAFERLKENAPLRTALRTFSATAVKIALRLGAVRADVVLAAMSMTISHLRSQLFQQAEEHKELLEKAKNGQPRTVAKAMSKLQRELDMTKRRAETLARQAQEARDEARALRAAGGAVQQSTPAAVPTASACMPATPLQRRVTSYLRNFEQFSTNPQ